MPRYGIEQYEVYTVRFAVDASNQADAIAKLFGGQATLIDDSNELIGICEDLGMPVDLHRSLARRLRKLGIAVGKDVIPSIRSLEEIV